MPTHAYLCFDGQDRGYGRRLAQFLMASGVRVWWDVRNERTDALDDTAKRMVAASGVLVVVLSKHSASSPKLHRLVVEAALANRTTIMLVIDNVTVPPQFREVQRVRIRRRGMPSAVTLEQLKELTGLYESTEDDEDAPVAVATAGGRSARPPLFTAAQKAVAVIVGIAVVGCVAWRPSAAYAALSLVGSFFGGFVQFFRTLSS